MYILIVQQVSGGLFNPAVSRPSQQITVMQGLQATC
jgi:hypothetical protein